jgi:hypothetical protein
MWLNLEICIITLQHKVALKHLIKFYLKVEIAFDPCYRAILHSCFIVSQNLVLFLSRKQDKSLNASGPEL